MKQRAREYELSKVPVMTVQELIHQCPAAVGLYYALVRTTDRRSRITVGTRADFARRTGFESERAIGRYLKVLERARWIDRKVRKKGEVRLIVVTFIHKKREPPCPITDQRSWRGVWKNFVRRICAAEPIGSQRRPDVRRLIAWVRDNGFDFPKLRCGDKDFVVPILRFKKIFMVISPRTETEIAVRLDTSYDKPRGDKLEELLESTERTTDQLDAATAELYKRIITDAQKTVENSSPVETVTEEEFKG